jgi:hypothetical protein
VERKSLCEECQYLSRQFQPENPRNSHQNVEFHPGQGI